MVPIAISMNKYVFITDPSVYNQMYVLPLIVGVFRVRNVGSASCISKQFIRNVECGTVEHERGKKDELPTRYIRASLMLESLPRLMA